MANPVFGKSPAFQQQNGYAGFNSAQQTPQNNMPPQAPQFGGQTPQFGNQPNPSAEQLSDMYKQPTANATQTGRMSYDDVFMKLGISFGVLLATAAGAWILNLGMGIAIGAALAALVVYLVATFKKEPSPGLVLAYAALEGVFVGAFSHAMNNASYGIVVQAVIGTLIVVGITTALYKSGTVRATPKFRKIVSICLMSYFVFATIRFVLQMTGVIPPLSGNMLWIGIGISLFAITLGAATLVVDFDNIEQGVRNGIPEKYSWTCALGILVTVVWIYIEMLRLIWYLKSLVSD